MATRTIRMDEDAERALAALREETGASVSEVVRNALLESERAHRRARLRAEAEQLNADPEERAAAKALAAEMDALRAW